MRKFALFLPAVSSISHATKNFAVQKVIDTLTEMKQEAVTDKAQEYKDAGEFALQCSDEKGRLEREIADLNGKIEDENANIAEANASSEKLESELAALAEVIRLDELDLKQAKRIRELEETDFVASNTDYEESKDALSAAISHLKTKEFNASDSGTASFLQTAMKSGGRSTAKKVTAFLTDKMASQPSSAGFESAMGGVINMLGDLLKKFSDEQRDIQRDNMTKTHTFEELQNALIQKKRADTEKQEKKTLRKADKEAKGEAATGEKKELLADKKATKQDLRDHNLSCNRNNKLYAKQQKMRSEEITALDQALEIIGGSAMKTAAGNISHRAQDAASDHVFFLQLGSSSDNDNNQIAKISTMLLEKSNTFHSKILAALSLRIKASPFKKVLVMVRDMVSRLQKQATDEAKHRGWCEASKAEKKIDLEGKQDNQSSLSAEQEGLVAKVAGLESDIENLTKEINFLTQDRGAATEQRTKDSAENKKVIEESKVGQQAVADAVKVLTEYYASAKESAASDDGAGAVTEIYGGQQTKSTSVVDMLKVIESDFSREEASRTAAEAEQASAYKKLMNSAEIDAEVKKTTKNHKKKVLGNSKKELTRVTNELQSTTEAVNSVQKQLEEVNAQCAAQVTFEERQQLRANEIQSLKDALIILSDLNK